MAKGALRVFKPYNCAVSTEQHAIKLINLLHSGPRIETLALLYIIQLVIVSIVSKYPGQILRSGKAACTWFAICH